MNNTESARTLLNALIQDWIGSSTATKDLRVITLRLTGIRLDSNGPQLHAARVRSIDAEHVVATLRGENDPLTVEIRKALTSAGIRPNTVE